MSDKGKGRGRTRQQSQQESQRRYEPTSSITPEVPPVVQPVTPVWGRTASAATVSTVVSEESNVSKISAQQSKVPTSKVVEAVSPRPQETAQLPKGKKEPQQQSKVSTSKVVEAVSPRPKETAQLPKGKQEPQQQSNVPTSKIIETVLPKPQEAAQLPKEKQEQQASKIESEISDVQKGLELLQFTITKKNEFPKKPSERCSLGKEIRLLANHFGINISEPISVYHYDVSIFKSFIHKKSNKRMERDINTRDMAKGLFDQLIKSFPKYKNKIFYDFRKSLYSLEEIPQPFEIKMKIPKLEDKEFILRLKIAKDNIVNVNPNEMVDQASLQVLQLMITHNFSYRCVNLFRSFFPDDCKKTELGFNVNLWKGFYTSVRPSEMGFNLNTDVANAVFFGEGNLIDLALQLYGCRINDLLAKMKNDGGREFMNKLGGKKVKTHLLFTKKIERLGPTANGHVFEHDGKKTTITEYFKEKGIILKYPNLPCVCLGKENYTPLELCTTELANVKKLDPKQTSDMIKATAVPCYQRRQDIENLMNQSGLQNDPILKQFNIQTKLKMIEMKGRVLGAPDLEYSGSKTKSEEIGLKGQWDNMRKRFLEPKELTDWVVVSFARNLHPQKLEDFIGSLIETGRKHGLKINDPLDWVDADYRADANKAREVLTNCVKKNPKLKFVFAVMPSTTRVYNALKTFGDVLSGIITQAIDENSIDKQRGRYDRLASNVCLKINAKLGGRNFRLSRENELFKQYLQKLYDGPLMILGADVNHPSPVDNEVTESIAAVVGSIDNDCCYYAARMLAQRQLKGQALELIYDLNIMVFELLQEYFKANQKYPKRLIFLRDGVSEGQFGPVSGHEMNQIREACQRINPGYKPGITFVVVQKRHHTRLFPMDKNDESGRAGNVPPGTMVDTKIITPDMFDFFLCSHMGIQGTSKPCHYFILHDDNEFKMNQIALLCHYLCHIFSRSTTSVSYPAPTYYADLCAARGREYLHRKNIEEPIGGQIKSESIPVHLTFRNKMFFI